MASSSFYSGSSQDATNVNAVEDSKNAAALSETAAAASATASAGSATASAGSATTAATKASESASSATSSATSASASQASRVASEAAKVASEAAQSASENARDAAAASSTSASSSQAAAATSAATAATEASNSATSASASEASNVAAGVAKVAAETAETAAQTAQAAAEAAEAATEALFDQFGDQYLGPKASDPTVDNDGNPLAEGAVYFNTANDVLKFYSGSAWVAPESVASTAAAAAQAAQVAAETAKANAETAEVNAETAEANAASSAAAAANSASAASTSEANADTSEANALTYSSNAATSAAAAASSAAGIAGYDLDVIAETKGVTAVDVFVYDTSKDSDGGAWRKRTQHTSWYNEALNNATRGSRKEFPAVAVIVAESNKVTIYDGDDPSLPMWMVFEGNTTHVNGKLLQADATTGRPVSSVMMLNGLFAFTVDSTWLSYGQVNFISEDIKLDYLSGQRFTVATRNDPLTQNIGGDFAKAFAEGNDVAMTVLPNAPIDAATGLAVPTIALATDGGVSVIKDDGTVVDSASTLTFGRIDTDKDGIWYWRSAATYSLLFATWEDVALGDGFGDFVADTNAGNRIFDLVVRGDTLTSLNGDLALGGAGSHLEAVAGLMLHQPNYTDQSKGMSALLTSTYNTGWMNGDIKGAFLSDTDTADLVGSGELISNGGFDDDTTGWTASGQNALITWDDAGYLVLRRNGTSAVASQTIPTVSGETYVISFDLVANTGSAELGVTFGSTQSSRVSSAGTYTFTATASSASTVVSLNTYNTSVGSLTIDNISVKLADADRSVNNNGLVVSSKTYDPWHDDLNLAFDDESFTVDREASDFMSALTHDASSNATMTGSYGPELVTNGGFDDASVWSATGEAEIANGQARIYSSDGSISQVLINGLLEVGKTYEVTYQVTASLSGGLLSIDGSATSYPSEVGWHKITLTPDNTNFGIKRQAGVTDIYIDNISVREVPKVQWRPHNLLAHSEDVTSQSYIDFGNTGNITVVDSETITFAAGAANFSNQTLQGTNLVGQTITGAVQLSSQTHAGEKVQLRFNWRSGSEYAGSVYTLTATPTFVYITATVPAGTTGVDLIVYHPVAEYAQKTFTATKWHLYRSDLGGMAPVPSDFQTADSETYVSTTSSARYLPRLGHHVYNGSAWVNEGLLHESEARTNLITYSDFDTVWFTNRATLTTNASTSPDGTASAASLVEDTTASDTHRTGTTVSGLTSDASYTISVYAKANGRNYICLQDGGAGGTNNRTFFDISTGEVALSGSPQHTAASIQEVGNDWYRCSLTYTVPSTSTETTWLLCLALGMDETNSADFVYTGDGTSGVYLYGAQLEQGSTPSSYIPTSGATATRASESLTIPAANLPYSSTAMTIQMDGRVTYADRGIYGEARLHRWAASETDKITAELSTNSSDLGKLFFIQEAGDINDFVVNTSDDFTPDILVPYSMSSRHGSTFINGAVDGVALTANTTPTALPDLSSTDLQLGERYNGTIRNFRMWGNDIKDDGIEVVTQPSLSPSLGLSFDGSEASQIQFDWSEK